MPSFVDWKRIDKHIDDLFDVLSALSDVPGMPPARITGGEGFAGRLCEFVSAAYGSPREARESLARNGITLDMSIPAYTGVINTALLQEVAVDLRTEEEKRDQSSLRARSTL